MVNELEVNSYICAKEVLNDDPDYNRCLMLLWKNEKPCPRKGVIPKLWKGCRFPSGISGLYT